MFTLCNVYRNQRWQQFWYKKVKSVRAHYAVLREMNS